MLHDRDKSQKGRRWSSGLGNARETACRIIQDKIVNLEYKPSEPLSDKALAEELEMSRTPVREALIILATANMVVLKPQIGTFVAPIDIQRMEMEQFARYTMEKEIVSLACRHVSEETKWRYEENLRSYQHYAESNDKDRTRRLLMLDNDFHRIAFESVGREDNYYYMLDGMKHIERLRVLSVMGLSQETTREDHQAISRAVSAGDRKTAMLCVERHLNRYRENITEIQSLYPEYFSLG